MSSEPILPVNSWLRDLVDAWNRFWFAPSSPATVCLIRILAGAMLFYTHLVWTLELPTFFANEGVFSPEYRDMYSLDSPFVWSHFDWFSSAAWLWGSHIAALAILFALMIGLCTRVTSILAFLIVVSYCNRATGALFGLDQINGFLALYLAVAPCGMMYSVDAWLARRRSAREGGPPESPASSLATVATRLMQLHLCVVYFFAGVGKLQGTSWWDGTAIWGALASYEYQTMDVTFLVHVPWFVNILTLTSVFWEVSYPFMIWPRLTRPIWLFMAIPLHLGIGMCMGMMTFGYIMLVANAAFLPPQLVERFMALPTRWLGGGRTAT